MKKTLILFSSLFLIYQSAVAQADPGAILQPPLAELPPMTLEAAGLEQDSLDYLIDLIQRETNPDFRGMVVLKDQHLLYEQYLNTYWRATLHDIRSAGKSITAMLVGIAIDKGLIQGVDQPVYSFFPPESIHITLTERHKRITLHHLLTMSSGLAADTDDIQSPGHALYMMGSQDWVDFALNLPMAFDPGERWVYNDASALLCGAIVEQVSGKSLAAFADEHLFGPLGITDYYWFSGPKGTTSAMGNLYLSTLDFAKLGQVLINQGQWQGQQLISPQWIEALTSPHLDLSETDPFAHSYGYLWYLGTKEVDGTSYEYVFASGNGGNKVYVVPELQLVVALQSSAYGRGYGHGRAEFIFARLVKWLHKP